MLSPSDRHNVPSLLFRFFSLLSPPHLKRSLFCGAVMLLFMIFQIPGALRSWNADFLPSPDRSEESVFL